MIDNIKMILATQEALREAGLWVNTATATAIAKTLMERGVSVVKDINVPSNVPDTNVGKWIPVSERLPEIIKIEHACRNVYRTSGRVLCACLQAGGKQMVKEGYMQFFNDFPETRWIIPGTIHSVTHWMPLPEPPKGE